MSYIEIVTIDQDKYYIQAESLVAGELEFWNVVHEINENKIIVFRSLASGSLFSMPTSRIIFKQIITADELPLTRKPHFVKLSKMQLKETETSE
ncbi:hypothetical protein [Vagococcus salmoninarum]|uniref:hypothetical protein n=1 Tax=Vagococcus salmoninarum TaxID=2739 RepID=UPI003F9BA183